MAKGEDMLVECDAMRREGGLFGVGDGSLLLSRKEGSVSARGAGDECARRLILSLELTYV